MHACVYSLMRVIIQHLLCVYLQSVAVIMRHELYLYYNVIVTIIIKSYKISSLSYSLKVFDGSIL